MRASPPLRTPVRDLGLQVAPADQGPEAFANYLASSLPDFSQDIEASQLLEELLPEQQPRAIDALHRITPHIAAHYGSLALSWLALHSDRHSLPWQELAKTDIDPYKLLVARSWGTQRRDSRFSFVKEQYDLDTSFSTAVAEAPLDDIINNNVRSGKPFSAQRLAKYGIETYNRLEYYYYGQVQSDTRPFSDWIYLDAPLGFSVTYNGIPQIVAGTGLSYRSELMLYQMQRLKLQHSQSGRGWPPLNWTGVLVDIANHIGRKTGRLHIGIQESAKNYWAKQDVQALSKQAAHTIYDQTAMHQGFWRGQDGDWHRTIMSDS